VDSNSDSVVKSCNTWIGEEAQKSGKIVFLQISRLRAARVRWVTFVAWAAYRLRGLTLVGRNGRGGMKNKGADPGRAQRAAEKAPHAA
jgi:hypothetical protein